MVRDPQLWRRDLHPRLAGQILDDAEPLEEVTEDFGHIVRRRPGLVVRPRTTDDVAAVVRYAAQLQIPVATHSAAHSQSGQSLVEGGILLDMRSLDRIHEINETQLWFLADAGVVWKDLVAQVYPRGLIPPVLTNNLNVTLGGTLSMAGLGISSFRYGTQADNCLAVEVVAGTGEVLWCTPDQNEELFLHALCGLGQFGVITRVKHRLRRYRPLTRTFHLLYDHLGPFLDDARRLMAEGRIDYIEAWSVPCPQGFRSVQGMRRPFARWFYPLHITVEADDSEAVSSAEILDGLQYYEHVHTEDQTTLEFALRLEPLFAIWRKIGYWDRCHPWMEVTLPWSATQPYIATVLDQLSPVFLGGGHILLWPARGRQSRMPMFRVPDEEFVMGFGILPGIPRSDLEQALPLLNQASDLSMQMGGKRYLSGWVDFDLPRWRTHFGDLWPRLHELKRKYDPAGILNPGFIRYEAEVPGAAAS